MWEYKILISNDQEEINAMLDEGWIIDSVTAQYVVTSSISYIEGKFLIVFKK